MKELLKTLLVLGGGGLAVWYFMRGREAQATTGTSTTTTTTPPPPATMELIRAASIQAGYPSGSLLNCDQWNYFYSGVRGIAGPDPLVVWPERDRSYQMTIEEWWTGVSQHGLSGVRPWRDPAFEAWGIRC